jgi:hypothetical protein
VPIENRPLQALARRASASADASDVPRLAQADRWPKAFTPIEIGLPRRLRAGRRPPPTQATFPGWRRRTVGRRPSRRLKSAFSGACAPCVGLRRRKERFSVGAGRPLAEGLRRPNSFGAPRAERQPPPTRGTFRSPWPKAFTPIETGACAPGVGLRRRKGRWPKAFTPIEIGLLRRLRAGRRPPPTQRMPFRSAQADRRPKAFTPIEIGLLRRSAPGVGLRRRKECLSGRRRPTVGRRPLQVEFIRRSRPTVGQRPHPVEFIRHTGRPSAAGLPRSNSSDAPGRPCSPMGPGRNRRDEADGNGRSV